jgi:hypothetical protein
MMTKRFLNFGLGSLTAQAGDVSKSGDRHPAERVVRK